MPTVRLRAVLLVMVLSACTSLPPPDATGEEIYQQLCASCHGDDLEGGIGPALGPGSNSATQDDEFLQLSITRGRGRMPSFGAALDEDQLGRLVDYLRRVQQS